VEVELEVCSQELLAPLLQIPIQLPLAQVETVPPKVVTLFLMESLQRAVDQVMVLVEMLITRVVLVEVQQET
jgi:hypothetical protein